MKRNRVKGLRMVLMVMLSVAMMCILMACGKSEKENDASISVQKTENPQGTTADAEESDDMDVSEQGDASTSDSGEDSGILIAYFSWSGNSKSEAELIQEKTGGTIFEIAREEPYPEDYTECTEVAEKEKEDNARPSIKNPLESLDEYDKIVLCYPIWWHTAPMCVGTFLEKYNLQGKMIYPVSQSASMDEDQFAESVEFVKACAKGAEVQEGLFVDVDDIDAVEDYVESSILN